MARVGTQRRKKKKNHHFSLYPASLTIYNYTIPYVIRAFNVPTSYICQSQCPPALRSGSAAARLLRLWVRIPPGAWMFICCGCCVLSGRGLFDELITHPEESYRRWCVVVCDLETS